MKKKYQKVKILNDYLQGKINPVFEKLLVDLLLDRPKNIVIY